MGHLRKKIEARYFCGIHVAHQRHMWQTVCMYTVYQYLFALHSLRFPRDLQFQVIDISVSFLWFDYGSAKEACENFARLIENNTGIR
jgi:hypothetical protein